jgi:mRNA interferase RelE/StbE
MAYRVEIKPKALRALAKAPNPQKRRIAKAIDALAADPRPAGCRKLAGSEDTYRVRVGDYRVVYEIADRMLIVYVVRIGHRKDVYRGL